MHQRGSGQKKQVSKLRPSRCLHTNHQSLFIMKHVFIAWEKLLSVPDFFFLYLFCFLQKHWAGLPLASNQNLCSIKMCFITEIWLTTCVHWTPCHWTIGAESTDDIWLWTSSGWRKAQAKSYCSCLSFLNGWTQQHSESILMNPVCSSLSHSCDLNHRPPLHNL